MGGAPATCAQIRRKAVSTQQLNPRTVYLPAGTGPDRAVPARPSLVSQAMTAGPEFARSCVSYYREPLSWLALGVTSVILCYGGGAAMFWFHSEHLGEGGPNIPWYVHWLLDSTFGFLVLTPALVL